MCSGSQFCCWYERSCPDFRGEKFRFGEFTIQGRRQRSDCASVVRMEIKMSKPPQTGMLIKSHTKLGEIEQERGSFLAAPTEILISAAPFLPFVLWLLSRERCVLLL